VAAVFAAARRSVAIIDKHLGSFRDILTIWPASGRNYYRTNEQSGLGEAGALSPAKGGLVKHLKILGLAVIAAVALTALLGVGTASATTLCEEGTITTCTKHVNSGSTLKFSAEESVKLLGPFNLLIDTCTVSTVEGPTTSTGNDTGGAVTGNVNVLTFETCTRTTTVGAKGTLSVTNIAGTDNGTVTSSGATVTIHNIPGFGTCSYVTTNTDIGTLTGSTTTPTFDISATIPSETGGCPSGTWSGKYVYTAPASGNTPFFISAG
jgi:hypothetical protein